jgi:ABC-type bacteriocin/lantibiotic exporter with double-glycine peptidase domain
MADSQSRKRANQGSAPAGPAPLAFLILLALFSCAGPSSSSLPTKGARIVEGVPFYPQEEYQCGPASLAGVLNYYGLKVTPAEIAAEIFSRHARGTLDMDMVFYAQKKGLKAEQYSGSFEDLRRSIDSRQPLIVLVDQGFWVYQKSHFMVVVGYDEKGVRVNSGKEEQKFLSQGSLSKTWERAKFWTLKITPP